MNDKDKEAFEKWFSSLDDSHLSRVIKLNRGASQKAWQSACEYKQKEIDDLADEVQTIDFQSVKISELEVKLVIAIKYFNIMLNERMMYEDDYLYYANQALGMIENVESQYVAKN